MGCASSVPKNQQQCTAEADKTSDGQSQDNIHSAEIIQAVDSAEQGTQPRRPKIKFPPASSKETWASIDTTIYKALQKDLRGMTYDKRLDSFADIVYKICKDTFGVIETKAKQPAQKNRRQRKMTELRNQKRHLKKLAHKATPEQKEGYLKLWNDLREKHSALSKAERARKKRHERKKPRIDSSKNPSSMLEVCSINQDQVL